MAGFLIIGDSQAFAPGNAAKAALEAMGHTATVIHNDGQGPVAYVSTPSLMAQYTNAARGVDLVVLVFGHNDLASARTAAALVRLRDAVRPPVWMSGPPQYPPTAAPTSTGQPSQAAGAALRAQNASIFGARYIDAWPSTPPELPRDSLGWHLTPSSAQPWGQAIAAAITAPASSQGSEIGKALVVTFGLWALWKWGAA